MLMRKNANNDVSKDSPIVPKDFLCGMFNTSSVLENVFNTRWFKQNALLGDNHTQSRQAPMEY